MEEIKSWTNEERSAFIEVFKKYPKDFRRIGLELGKSTAECVHCYYHLNRKDLSMTGSKASRVNHSFDLTTFGWRNELSSHDVSIAHSIETEECQGFEFCKLGCVCVSISHGDRQNYMPSTHCGHPKCMFEDKCKSKAPSYRLLYRTIDVSNILPTKTRSAKSDNVQRKYSEYLVGDQETDSDETNTDDDDEDCGGSRSSLSSSRTPSLGSISDTGGSKNSSQNRTSSRLQLKRSRSLDRAQEQVVEAVRSRRQSRKQSGLDVEPSSKQTFKRDLKPETTISGNTKLKRNGTSVSGRHSATASSTPDDRRVLPLTKIPRLVVGPPSFFDDALIKAGIWVPVTFNQNSRAFNITGNENFCSTMKRKKFVMGTTGTATNSLLKNRTNMTEDSACTSFNTNTRDASSSEPIKSGDPNSCCVTNTRDAVKNKSEIATSSTNDSAINASSDSNLSSVIRSSANSSTVIYLSNISDSDGNVNYNNDSAAITNSGTANSINAVDEFNDVIGKNVAFQSNVVGRPCNDQSNVVNQVRKNNLGLTKEPRMRLDLSNIVEEWLPGGVSKFIWGTMRFNLPDVQRHQGWLILKIDPSTDGTAVPISRNSSRRMVLLNHQLRQHQKLADKKYRCAWKYLKDPDWNHLKVLCVPNMSSHFFMGPYLVPMRKMGNPSRFGVLRAEINI